MYFTNPSCYCVDAFDIVFVSLFYEYFLWLCGFLTLSFWPDPLGHMFVKYHKSTALGHTFKFCIRAQSIFRWQNVNGRVFAISFWLGSLKYLWLMTYRQKYCTEHWEPRMPRRKRHSAFLKDFCTEFGFCAFIVCYIPKTNRTQSYYSLHDLKVWLRYWNTKASDDTVTFDVTW